jgi:hypothetical protein
MDANSRNWLTTAWVDPATVSTYVTADCTLDMSIASEIPMEYGYQCGGSGPCACLAEKTVTCKWKDTSWGGYMKCVEIGSDGTSVCNTSVDIVFEFAESAYCMDSYINGEYQGTTCSGGNKTTPTTRTAAPPTWSNIKQLYR